ncbi:MAG: N-acetylmuramoyl-L-alanine amidase [Aestuariivita sp.]|nr:N-acetylmuramoyl-L-alanine amidase [Aestuariivita sp.]
MIQSIWHSSPNFGHRRDKQHPSLVVLHYTAMDNADTALERLCDENAQVSTHYLIAENGQLWQLVKEQFRAWHAGKGSWYGVEDINSASIGIELDNDGKSPYCSPQIETLIRLLTDILDRWELPPKSVIGHSDIAPGRKWDPGPKFDWNRLSLHGLAIKTVKASAYPSDQNLDELLKAAGYTSAASEEHRLLAFRQRHRSYFKGPPDEVDKAILYQIATSQK